MGQRPHPHEPSQGLTPSGPGPGHRDRGAQGRHPHVPEPGCLLETSIQAGQEMGGENILERAHRLLPGRDLGPILNFYFIFLRRDFFIAFFEHHTQLEQNKACTKQECLLRQEKAEGSGRQDFGRGADPRGDEDS